MTLTERLAHWRDFWGDPADRPNPYGSPGPLSVYAKGYHRGEDVANDRKPEAVPCLRPGRIVWTGRSRLIGFYIVVDPDGDSRYDIYCHMYEPTARRTGPVVTADIIGRTADWGEDPGGGWDGPHLHFVIADAVGGGYDVNIRDHDPRPVIAAALAAPTGLPNEEDDMDANQNAMLTEIHRLLTAGKTGAYGEGALSKKIGAIASTVSDAKAAAVDAKTASEALVADFRAGESGVRQPGRLLSLLNKAAAGEISVDTAAIVKAVVAELGDVAGATPTQVEAVVTAALRAVVLRVDVG